VILVAGDGPVARALSAALAAKGEKVARWIRVTVEKPAISEVAIVAVADRAIAEVAAKLVALGAVGPTTVLLHCAGAIPAEDAFSSVRAAAGGIGLLHPLRAFAGAAGDSDLAGTVFGIEGDARGREVATGLAILVGGRPLPLEGAGLSRYHAAAALAGNHTLGLVAAAIDLLVAEGLPRAEAARSLGALLASAARNVAERGLPDALTGPIVRGDLPSVERHLAALSGEARTLYRRSARPLVAQARQRAKADPAALDAIARLLADED
jgi:predicted short-subunit dehydrogenase-like oxidoreductase (DUF2520 family)